jgi:DNA transformation protein
LRPPKTTRARKREPRAAPAAGLFDHIADLLADIGPVKTRNMFGSASLRLNNVLLGIVVDDRIHVRTDAGTRPQYLAEGSKPFEFEKHDGEHIVTSYYALPDRLYDEPDQLRRWLLAAYEAALVSPSAIKRRQVRERRAAKSRKKKAREAVRLARPRRKR